MLLKRKAVGEVQRAVLVIALSLAVSSLACAGKQSLASKVEPRPLGASLAAYRAPAPGAAPSGDPAPVAMPESNKSLTLPGALALALERSPKLASFSWEIRVREGDALQEGLFPNPELEMELEEFAGSGELSGFDATEGTLAISQLIETGGKRGKRRRAATIDAEVAAWEYEAARLEIYADVVKAFARVHTAQKMVALEEELHRLAQSLAGAVDRLVEAGAASPVEKKRARVEEGAARLDLATARRGLESARAQLAATWGALAPDFVRVEGDLAAVTQPPDLEKLRNRLQRSPELARWQREVARREAVVEREKAKRFPDVTALAGARRLSELDENAFIAGLKVPLPLFNRNQGAIAAARGNLRKAQKEQAAAEARLHADLDTAYRELIARRDEVEGLRSDLIPGAREAYEAVREGYLLGLFRNVDVLDAQRRLSELSLRELEALQAYHVAKADIERLTGTPLAGEAPEPGEEEEDD
ncbi:MAG: TolC family protein [Deltaproteobacteria bacterium]|nr:TolC family protein [Deltaproteobacteria bacterium]